MAPNCDGAGALQERNFHLGIAAWRGCIHSRNNSINVALYGRALRIAKDHDGDSAAFEVLLVLDVFVRGQRKVEPGFFRRLQQRAIGQAIPSFGNGFYNGMTGKPAGNASRCTVVKENEHLRALPAPSAGLAFPGSGPRNAIQR